MEIQLLSGLIATDFQIEGVDTFDYPKFCDAYIMGANVYDNAEWREATEVELDELNEDGDLVYRLVIENIF